MKPQVGIFIIVLVFLGAFLVYSLLPDQTSPPAADNADTGQANISESIEPEPPDNQEGSSPETTEEKQNINIGSTEGLDEELRGIVEGLDMITGELESLEGTSTGITP